MVANHDEDRNAQPIPNDDTGDREAQDRSKGRHASSPVDAMHVDAPKERDDASGHREGKQRSE